MYAVNNEGLRQRPVSRAPQHSTEAGSPLHESLIDSDDSKMGAVDPLKAHSTLDTVIRSSSEEVVSPMRSSANTTTWSQWAWSWVPSFGSGKATAGEFQDRFDENCANDAKIIREVLTKKGDELEPKLSAADKAKLQRLQKSSVESPALVARMVDQCFEIFSRYLAYPALNQFFQGLVHLAWPNLEVSGLDNIPLSGSVIFVVAPHQSHMDGPTVIRAINGIRSQRSGDLRVRPAASSHLFELKPPVGWVVGTLLKIAASIPIERDDANRAVARARLMSTKHDLDKEDTMVMIFPEGGRNRGDTISVFASGAFDLAKTAKKPIVPVLIDGTRQMWHQNHKGLFGLLSSWGKAVGQRFSGTPSPAGRVAFMKPMRIADETRAEEDIYNKYDAKAMIRRAASDFTGWEVKDEKLVPHGGAAAVTGAAAIGKESDVAASSLLAPVAPASNDEIDVKAPVSKL